MAAGFARLDTVLKEKKWSTMNRRLESRLNPQAGKPALRSAHFQVCGFWGLSSPQLENSVKMRRCGIAAFLKA